MSMEKLRLAKKAPQMKLTVIDRRISKAEAALRSLKERRIELVFAGRRANTAAQIKPLPHEQCLVALKRVAGGEAMKAVAKDCGMSVMTLQVKIKRAWEHEFPCHYRTHRPYGYNGFVTTLRNHPPLFGVKSKP